MTNTKVKTRTHTKTKILPQFKVILHNDDTNQAQVVVRRIIEFTPLKMTEAIDRTIEAHELGQSLLMVCHKERAELIQEQFDSCYPPIIVTVEPDT